MRVCEELLKFVQRSRDSQLDLVGGSRLQAARMMHSRLSHEFKPQVNGLASLGLLSCSAIVGMTLQFPCMLHACANFGNLPVASHPRVQSRVFESLHNLEHFFTLSHTLPLHDFHLNTWLLIARIQVNLVRNKANKMVD